MTETENQPRERQSHGGKPYDLEERTFEFARRVRALVRGLPKTLCNIEDARQLVKASGSVGANYIEAIECLGDKDRLLHLRITRKEAKESRYWLRLLYTLPSTPAETERNVLVQEATELMRIFGAIIRKKE